MAPGTTNMVASLYLMEELSSLSVPRATPTALVTLITVAALTMTAKISGAQVQVSFYIAPTAVQRLMHDNRERVGIQVVALKVNVVVPYLMAGELAQAVHGR